MSTETGIAMPLKLKGDRAAAAFLGCHRMTIRKLRLRGEIPFMKVGRAYFYDSAELWRKFHN